MYYPPSIQPTRPPSALAHLTPEDQARFLQYSFAPTRAIPFPIVHHAFEHHVQREPNAICIEHEAYGHRMTYAEVDRFANRLARRIRNHLLRQGSCPLPQQQQEKGLRICILARRSVYFVIAILAVLKSGGQYVPIDAATVTDAALRHVINDSSPAMVLVMEEYLERLNRTLEGVDDTEEEEDEDDDSDGDGSDDSDDAGLLLCVPQICIEQAMEEDELLNADGSKLQDATKPEDGCYIIYTSGTTGVPKGVDVRHIGVANVICAPPGNVHMKPGMRVAQLLNIAFDMGAWEILSSLYNGCTLCIRGNTFKEWVSLLKSVDVVISTPSILARHNPADYPNIKHVIVGGEVCPQSLADTWATYTQFNNCCGPTEISVCNTVQPHTPGYPLSIGIPIPNTSLYILSQDYDPSTSDHAGYPPPPPPPALPIGQIGSMWVGGIGVSKGYLNLPSKTAERWLPDPFRRDGQQPQQDGGSDDNRVVYMMFNTNDLGRWRDDGQLEHCGRADDQVKVRGGFRVELDGVASAMRRASSSLVEAAVALLVDGILWGFVMRRRREYQHHQQRQDEDEDERQEIEEVEKCTREVMSYYAVPERWMIMDEFPMTRNGKVDKRALMALAVEKERRRLKGQVDEEKEEEENMAVQEEEKEVSGQNERNVEVVLPTVSSAPSTPTVSIPTTPTTERDDTDMDEDDTNTPITPFLFTYQQQQQQQQSQNRHYHPAHANTHHVIDIPLIQVQVSAQS